MGCLMLHNSSLTALGTWVRGLPLGQWILGQLLPATRTARVEWTQVSPIEVETVVITNAGNFVKVT
jgi:hypothetical protein